MKMRYINVSWEDVVMFSVFEVILLNYTLYGTKHGLIMQTMYVIHYNLFVFPHDDVE